MSEIQKSTVKSKFKLFQAFFLFKPMTETTETQTTVDAQEQNTGDSANTGAVTHTEQTQIEANKEKTFTQAEVDAMFQKRLKTAVKSELKKAIGENSDAPTVEELQQGKKTSDERANRAEARLDVRDYLFDTKNKTGADAASIRTIEKLVLAEIEYDDDGKPTNLKEAVERVKAETPKLFAQSVSSINAGQRGEAAAGFDMNSRIRQSAGK